MSAFMFRANPEYIKKLTDEELRQNRDSLKDWLKTIEWEKLKQCTFEFDIAHGRLGTFRMMEWELELRANGKANEPLPTALVPGYNP